MTISKLFAKVFGEEIFENVQEGTDRDDSITSHTTPKENTLSRRDLEDMTLQQQMDIIKEWLQSKLNTCDANCETALKMQRENMKSRLGPALVIFDIDFSSTVRVSMDRLTVRSQGSFNTIKANVCVFGGCWMYEVHLHSKGVMQLGWASSKCVFNDNSGVGDSKMSYGFDGSKQQKWHISTNDYGEKWQIGDIIGVTIDVDVGTISYYRNGKSMGVAFTRLEKGPGITFFPAISLAYSQAVRANFGNFPFKYPVEGYLPLQAKPLVQLQKVDLLLGYLVNLATILALKATCREKKQQKDDKLSTRKTVYVIFATLITEKLANWLFNEYVIEDKLLLYLSNLAEETSGAEDMLVGSSKSVLGNLLSIFSNYFENDEYKFILKKLVNCLLTTYTHTHNGMDYSNQIQTLHIMCSLCNHPLTRKSLIEFKLFKKHCLPLFMYIRPPEFSYMQEFASDNLLWSEGLGGSKQDYNFLIAKVEKTVENLYAIQKKLLIILLTNNDGFENAPSSRKLFLSKLRKYVIDSSIEHRPFPTFFLMQSSLQHPIENTVSLSFVCILTDVNRTLFEKEMSNLNTEILAKLFVDGTLEYQQFDRLGGVVSHLRKAYRNEIISHLGAETANHLFNEERSPARFSDIEPNLILTTGPMSNIIAMSPNQGSVHTVFAHFINPRTHVSSNASFGNCKTENSLFELLDIIVIYYYSVGHKYIVKIAATRDEIATINLALKETKSCQEDVEKKLQILNANLNGQTNDVNLQLVTEMKANFNQRQQVFKKRSLELSRKQIWYRSVALSKQRSQLLIWLLEKTFSTLNSSSELGPLFSFAPELYINILPILLDTVMDFAFHDLAEQFELSNAEHVVKMAAEFLSLHAADSRIILASCKDSMLQALGTLSSHKAGMLALEKCPKKCQNALIRALLRPYENRAWGQSNWLLLRFWFGDGFAYRSSRAPCVWMGGNTPIETGICRSRTKNEQHTGLLHYIAPANPSKYYQKVIGAKLIEDEPVATIFLNSVLTQLNWAFSEFILLLQDMQNLANRQEMTMPDSKQSKICVMCFELTVSLMRCLEMIISIAPNIIHDPARPNSDLILARISQLCSQVLSRVTVPPGCFQFIVDLCSVDLNSITHFPIITAALGILLALMRPELDANKNPAKVTRITRALLTDPSFQFANLEFALGEIRTPILQQTEIPRGNFDPHTRAHIDPLTNDIRVATPRTATKRIRSEPPLIKFALQDYPTHITQKEIDDVHLLIGKLRVTQALLSDITLPSEDSLCPICCAKPIAVIFYPCKHQSCSYCIMQHLTNSKLCFYCKTMIKTIETLDGETIFTNTEFSNPHIIEQI